MYTLTFCYTDLTTKVSKSLEISSIPAVLIIILYYITSLGVTSESVMFSFSSKTGPEVSKTGLRLKINIVKMHINSQFSREPWNSGSSVTYRLKALTMTLLWITGSSYYVS